MITHHISRVSALFDSAEINTEKGKGGGGNLASSTFVTLIAVEKSSAVGRFIGARFNISAKPE